MNLKPFLIIPPVALGVLGFMWMTEPEAVVSNTQDEVRQAVRAMTVRKEPMVLSTTGYGRVEAVRSWASVSQTEGRVIELVEGLAIGTVVESGDLLVQIDPTDYELAIAKSEANVAAAEASLAELDQQEANSRRLLELEQRIFDVAEAEYERNQRLFNNGTASAATLDTAQKTLLAQENAVTTLQNTLELYPAQRASTQATLAVREAEVAEARRNLDNTTIVAPFRGRVSSEAAETGQFVRTGDELLTLDGIAAFEVVGAFQPQGFASVMRSVLGRELQDLATVDATQVVRYLSRANVEAFVVLEFGGVTARYPAQVVRFRGAIDSETGTIGIAVRVADPLVADSPGTRPPLELGTFVSVVLEAKTGNGVISVPRSVLHQDDDGQPFVYTADADDRLAVTPVEPGPVAGDRILIASGLSDGAHVLLSTPRPSIEGLALDVVTGDGAGQ